ncbi:FAD-dependent monooxygenase [Nonomuraea jabiensis]|uniref:FAD-dependent monooxygenase n=1 Tax=Nonomuraea jabiensis TaxID=882448 RepID=UPI00248442DA|nr:FAD-dependent monooxygenase [Nonomuraea jabiensis]
MLGDAAHAMSPGRGQGARQSLGDAVVLAAALADEPTIEVALHRYDAERRPRTQATACRAWAGAGRRLVHAPMFARSPARPKSGRPCQRRVCPV